MLCNIKRCASVTGSSSPDEADVHSEAAVNTAALEAHEDAIAHGRPLRILRVAVDARLRAAGGDRERAGGTEVALGTARRALVSPRKRKAMSSSTAGSQPDAPEGRLRTLFSGRAWSSRSTCCAWADIFAPWQPTLLGYTSTRVAARGDCARQRAACGGVQRAGERAVGTPPGRAPTGKK